MAISAPFDSRLSIYRTHAGGIIGSDFERQAVQQTPLGRFGRPPDIAPVAVFLASDDARWVTGEVLIVAGGL